MGYNALEVVKNRNEFYKDGYRRVILALLVSLIINVFLILALIVNMMNYPKPTYFAATNEGRIIPLKPLNQPNLSDRAILIWATNAATAVYSYNFVNYKEALQQSSKYFTTNGWQRFNDALEKSKQIEAVRENRYVVSAVPSGAPVISNKYVINNRFVWNVQIPLLVSYQNSQGSVNQSWLVSIKISRISTLDNVDGVGISQFVVKQV